MQEITKFKADDGTEFDSKSACLAHEALCAEIAEVMATLPKRPNDDGCRYSNGHGYLQHKPETFWKARDALLRIGNRLSPHKWFEQALADRTVHASWCGRLIDETSRPLANAWYRIYCTDQELREWGQPYFAMNPDKVEQAVFFELKAA